MSEPCLVHRLHKIRQLLAPLYWHTCINELIKCTHCSYLPENKFFLLFFMCMSLLLTCMSVHHMLAWWSRRSEEGIAPLELEFYMI